LSTFFSSIVTRRSSLACSASNCCAERADCSPLGFGERAHFNSRTCLAFRYDVLGDIHGSPGQVGAVQRTVAPEIPILLDAAIPAAGNPPAADEPEQDRDDERNDARLPEKPDEKVGCQTWVRLPTG
jgi:hypothetical protein